MRIGLISYGAVFLSFLYVLCVAEQIKIGVLMPFTPAGFLSQPDLFKGALQTAANIVLSDQNFIQVTNITSVQFIYLDSRGRRVEAIQKVLEAVSYNVSAMVGELHSSNTEVAALTLSHHKIPMCSGSATSPTLTRKTDFPNFYRTVNSDNMNSRAVVDLIEHMGWKQFAIIATNDVFGQGLAQEAVIRASQKGISVLSVQTFTATTGVSNSFLNVSSQLETIRSSGAKIIYVPGFIRQIKNVLITAHSIGMLSKEFVYICTESLTLKGLFRSLSQTNESYLLDGVIFTYPEDSFHGSPEYDAYLDSWRNNSLALKPNDPVPDDVSFGVFYHDCILSLLYGIQNVMKRNNGTLNNLLKGTYNSQMTFSAFSHPLLKGASGNLALESDGDRITPVVIGSFHNTTGMRLAFRWNNGTIFNLTDPLIFFDGTAAVPLDREKGKEEFVINASDAIGVVSLVAAILQIVLCVLFLIALLYYRNNSVIKSSSVLFCVLIVVGCIIGAASIFPLIGRPTALSCMARPWLMSISFCLIFANLVGKTWRIFKIFYNKDLKITTLTNGHLFFYTSLGLIFELILLLIWTVYDPLLPTIDRVSDSRYDLVVCRSSSMVFQSGIQWTLLGFNLLMTVFGGYLAIRTRNVESNYRESKYIGLAIYNIYVLSFVVLPIEYSSGTSVTAKFLVLVFGILMVSGFTLLVLFLPKFLLIVLKEKGFTSDHESSTHRNSLSKVKSGQHQQHQHQHQQQNEQPKATHSKEPSHHQRESRHDEPNHNLEIAVLELSTRT